MNKNLVPIHHDVCGGIAFYTTGRLTEFDDFCSDTVREIDGTIPVDGIDEIICGSCGVNVNCRDLGYEDELDKNKE